MGQYYRPLLIYENGEQRSAYTHDFQNGLKLMEHSWIGNNFVNAILHEIKDNPARVAWLGDYSDDVVDEIAESELDFGSGFITSYKDFTEKYQSVWSEDRVKDLPSSTEQIDLSLENADGFYLVNMTKKCYIDMGRYVKDNSMPNRFGDDGTWCINPLPLLTCVGNGAGGGDYYSDAGKEDVGSWAFDKIYITYLRPGNFEEVRYFFYE